MTTPEFTIDWPYGWQTRDGRAVKIYCTDAPGLCLIHGRVDGISRSLSWIKSGKVQYLSDDNYGFSDNTSLDLVNRPAPTVSVPVNKLHDGTIADIDYESFGLYSAIPVAHQSRENFGRPVKWFFVDEVETAK